MARKRVLKIGIDSSLLNFGNPSAPNPEHIKAAWSEADERLQQLGCDSLTCSIDTGPGSEAIIKEALSKGRFDCVMIGLGLRTLPKHTILFENIVDLVRRH